MRSDAVNHIRKCQPVRIKVTVAEYTRLNQGQGALDVLVAMCGVVYKCLVGTLNGDVATPDAVFESSRCDERACVSCEVCGHVDVWTCGRVDVLDVWIVWTCGTCVVV